MNNEKSYKISRYTIFTEKNEKLFLINTFSSSIIEVKKDQKEFIDKILKNSKLSYKSKKYYDYRSILISNNFMIDSSIDELRQMELLYKANYFNTESLRFTLLPTLKCNFSCPYCFEEGDTRYKWSSKDVKTIKLFVEKYFRNKKNISIALFGGEPLLEWRNVQDIFNYIIELKDTYGFEMSNSIATNGFLLSEKVIEEMVLKFNFNSFQISIDGCRRTHDESRCLKNGNPTFSVIIKNVKKLIKVKIQSNRNIFVNIRVNLMNNTIKEVKEFLDTGFDISERKYINIYFRPIYNTEGFKKENCNRDNLIDFFSLARELGYKVIDDVTLKSRYLACEGDGFTKQFQIQPDMSLWKCAHDTKCEIANFGFIEEDGSMNIDYSKLEKWSRNNPFNDDKCKNCIYLPICWGGCPLNFLKTNNRSCFYEKDFNAFDLFQ